MEWPILKARSDLFDQLIDICNFSLPDTEKIAPIFKLYIE